MTQKNKITDMIPKLILTSTNNDTEAENYSYNVRKSLRKDNSVQITTQSVLKLKPSFDSTISSNYSHNNARLDGESL